MHVRDELAPCNNKRECMGVGTETVKVICSSQWGVTPHMQPGLHSLARLSACKITLQITYPVGEMQSQYWHQLRLLTYPSNPVHTKHLTNCKIYATFWVLTLRHLTSTGQTTRVKLNYIILAYRTFNVLSQYQWNSMLEYALAQFRDHNTTEDWPEAR